MINTKRAGTECDLWAIGIIIYMSFEGNVPFSGESEQDLLDSITKDEPKFTAQTPEIA